MAKKTSSRKRTAKKTAAKSVETIFDVIGLARSESFNDFPGAVSVLSEAKTLPIMDRFEWRATSLRTFMAIWEAEKHLREFKQMHSDATVKKSYKVEDKTIMELMATYDDERADHRVVYQARNQ